MRSQDSIISVRFQLAVCMLKFLEYCHEESRVFLELLMFVVRGEIVYFFTARML